MIPIIASLYNSYQERFRLKFFACNLRKEHITQNPMQLRTICLILLAVLPLAPAWQQPRTFEQEAGRNTSAAGVNSHVSELPMRTLLYPGATSRIYVRMMPWFGDPRHIQIGYRSDDPEHIANQVTDMMARGIDGAIVDWYGPGTGVTSHSTDLLFKESERRGFQFAVSVDGGPLKSCLKRGCDVNAQVLSELKYAEKNYESSANYVRWQGRPVVFFFDSELPIDWQSVRAGLKLSPLFVFRNSGAFDKPFSDGAFAWVAPETVKPDDPEALQYLDHFYDRAQRSPEKFAVGSVYKGFDDARASWGKGRRIAENCGQTWLDTFGVINRHYSASHQLPAVLIVTWNDYEEGTAIEPGVGCPAQIKAWVSGSSLKWDFKGNRNTVSRFVIFDSPDRERLIPLGETGPGEKSFDLRKQSLGLGEHWLVVKAIGKPSMLDTASEPVKYQNSQ